MEQTSFLDQLTEQEQLKKKGWEELMKRGLEEQNMYNGCVVDYLKEQVKKMKEQQ